jgi:hypothetical protein
VFAAPVGPKPPEESFLSLRRKSRLPLIATNTGKVRRWFYVAACLLNFLMIAP